MTGEDNRGRMNYVKGREEGRINKVTGKKSCNKNRENLDNEMKNEAKK
jgi:hypothetical protein